MLKNYYDILGIPRQATDEVIRRAFRELALQFHPDRNDSEEAHHVFVELNEAYRTLIDPKARAAYNLQYDRHFDPDKSAPAASGTYSAYSYARTKRSSRYGRSMYSQRFRYKGGAVRTEGYASAQTSQETESPFSAPSDYYQARREAEQAGASAGYRAYAAALRLICAGLVVFILFLIADRLSAYRALPEPVVSAVRKPWTISNPSVAEVVTPNSRMLIHTSFMHMLPEGKKIEVEKTPWMKVPVKVRFEHEDELREVSPQGGLYGGGFLLSFVILGLSLATIWGSKNAETNSYLGTITLILAVMIFGWMFLGNS